MVSGLGDGPGGFYSTSPQLRGHPWWVLVPIPGANATPAAHIISTTRIDVSPTTPSLFTLLDNIFFLLLCEQIFHRNFLSNS